MPSPQTRCLLSPRLPAPALQVLLDAARSHRGRSMLQMKMERFVSMPLHEATATDLQQGKPAGERELAPCIVAVLWVGGCCLEVAPQVAARVCRRRDWWF